MKAMVLNDDHRLLGYVNALLRTDSVAKLAADAAFAHIVARCFTLCFANGKAVSDNVRRIADVKLLTIRFIQTEHL